jgi:hypothetical protein
MRVGAEYLFEAIYALLVKRGQALATRFFAGSFFGEKTVF